MTAEDVKAEKAGYLRGRGWTDEQIKAYFAGTNWPGWLPPWWKWIMPR